MMGTGIVSSFLALCLPPNAVERRSKWTSFQEKAGIKLLAHLLGILGSGKLFGKDLGSATTVHLMMAVGTCQAAENL